MRSFLTVIGALGLAATLAVAPAGAQQTGSGGQDAQLRVKDAPRSSVFDLYRELTQDDFESFVAELGPVLRFRQLGDAATLGKGNVEVSVQFGNTPFDDAKAAWSTTDRRLGRSVSFPQIVALFGVSDRVDLGVWGGFDPRVKYGLAGFDARIALMRQGPDRPVSISVRPSVGSLIGPSALWVGTASVDLSVSRAFGPVSPYVGVAASTSLGVEWSAEASLDPATAGQSVAYAGLAYRWRALVLSGEVEKGARFKYAFRVGTRF